MDPTKPTKSTSPVEAKSCPPADLIVIFGPPAVGKMTVGQSLAKLTGFRLFHNHMTIDLLTKLFPFRSKPFAVLCNEFRRRIIEESVAHPEFGSLIFTYVWALEQPSDKAIIDQYKEIVEKAGGRIFFVELSATLDERLVRNKSENRLLHKNKSNIKKTEQTIREWEEQYRMNSRGDFFFKEHHIKIDNTDLSADEAAALVVKTFGFARVETKEVP